VVGNPYGWMAGKFRETWLAGLFFFGGTASPNGAELRQMPDQLIPYEDLKSKNILYCKSYLWRLEKKRKFPRRVLIGHRAFYLEREIDAWIAARISERDAEVAA
jgi:predicted DNA-binding transcriptional regulator AlpA